MGREAAEEVLRGIENGPKANQFLRHADELLGQYSHFSPGMRQATQTIAPFLPWFLNAARFVYWTMPLHRTTTTAFLLNVEKAYNQEWEDQHKDTPPGSLRYALPTGKGGLVDVARYTPFGLTAPVVAGDPGSLAAPLLPQGSGLVNAAQGKDPFGNDLKVSPDSGDKSGRPTGPQLAGIAANQLAESFVPGLAIGRRLREGGSTSFANSTVFSPKVKPGTKHGQSAVRRTFDPFRPIYLKSGGASSGPVSPEQRALMREAQRQVQQQASPAASAEQKALVREAERLLRQQQGRKP